ncbi:unnamed protein product [Didymodactylos carnosus]|uniref:Uncharacterized protein n=1 Tax=Didymodactylos carnosus TaxID=1234261 RepID=A0A8S2RD39_9BILA|nr:unnamed protein product [Didymodactylos carnosus]CAF4161487.1 unnamed protein product [Didymodactylos carnosus]
MQENYGIFNSTRPPDFLQRKRDSTTLIIYFDSKDKISNKPRTYHCPVPPIITVIASKLNSATEPLITPPTPFQFQPRPSPTPSTNSSTKQRPKSFFQRFNDPDSPDNESFKRVARYQARPAESVDIILPSAVTFDNDGVFSSSPSTGEEPKLRRRFTFRRSLKQKATNPLNKEHEKLRLSFTKETFVRYQDFDKIVDFV